MERAITKWNQIRPEWPDRPFRLYGAGPDSGTFDYFTDAINGKEKASRGDYTASEDDNVLVQGIANDPDAIGYFGYIPFPEAAYRQIWTRVAEKQAGTVFGGKSTLGVKLEDLLKTPTA